jgi:hypothetical protein
MNRLFVMLCILVSFNCAGCVAARPASREEQSVAARTVVAITRETQPTPTHLSTTAMLLQPSQFVITVLSAHQAREADRLTLGISDSVDIVDVMSPTGIGQAEITSLTGIWPSRLVFRLHLQALEGFEVARGEQRFSNSLSSEENTRRHQASQTGQRLDPIEVEIPPKLLRQGVGSLIIQWVDWYRR